MFKKEIRLSARQMLALENSCYILGAAAFAVFIRWLQVTAGTNSDGLFNRSVWNTLVPLSILAGMILMRSMTAKLKKKRFYFKDELPEAMANTGKLYAFLRYAIGGAMSAGGLYLIVSCETAQEVMLLRIVGALGFLSGISFIWFTREFNRSERNGLLFRVSMCMPMLLFSFWLITTYKCNDINSVVWSYGVEIIACCFAIFAFFRAAGFAFETIDFSKFYNTVTSGIFILIIALADTRNLGQQIMLLCSALMLEYMYWISICGLGQREAPPSYQPTDGFERL